MKTAGSSGTGEQHCPGTMAAAASSQTEPQKLGWVAFTDPLQTDEDCGLQKPSLGQPGRDAFMWGEAPSLPAQQSGWVQFDERPWPASHAPTPPLRLKELRNSVCSSTSFWDAAPPSESSWTTRSLSVGASSCDLPSLNADGPPSQTPSRPHSPHDSVYQEDEGINMDSFSWTPDTKHTNGQSYARTQSFTSWVTFDDDDEEISANRPGRPSHINLDNRSHCPPQDANSNVIVPPIQQQVAGRHILGLSPDGITSPFALNSPVFTSNTPYNKKNPFLDEEFSNIQPSPINPFSSYFNKTESKTSTSNDSCLESPHVFSYSSPFFGSQEADIKRESILLFSPVRDSVAGVDRSCQEPRGDGLEQLKNIQITDPDQAGCPALPDDPVDVEEPEHSSYEPAHMSPQDGWPMLLRIPERKNIMSSRHWGPIFVRLTAAGQLQLLYEKGLEKPFKEFQLNPQHQLSGPKLQNYDENGRLHTISIDHVLYKERRKIQPKVAVVHMPVKEQLVKLGTINYQDFLSFQHALQEVMGRLPIETIPVSYLEEEVQVEVIDHFYGVLSNGAHRILDHLVVTHVNMLAFLTGSPPCLIGLNDIQRKGKEVVSRHDIIPNTTTRWIRLRNSRLHGCVDQKEFTESRAIAFTPPAGLRFELLQFQTAFAEKTLPFTLRTVVSVRGAEVELQSWLVMATGFSTNRDPLTLIPCENVMVRYPIPEMWSKNFRRESVTGEKSLKARFNKGASFGAASTSGSESAMRVTLGTAKYEHAFKSVVWRINRLPDKNSALGHPHTFFCRLELGSDWEVPPLFQGQVEVEFDMPAASASKATIRSLSVGERTDLKKWITYKSHYSYQVAIEQRSESIEAGHQQEQPGGCTQQ